MTTGKSDAQTTEESDAGFQPRTLQQLEETRSMSLRLGPEGYAALRGVGVASKYVRRLLVERAAEWSQAVIYLESNGWTRNEVLFCYEALGGIPHVSSSIPLMLILSEAISAWGEDARMRRRHGITQNAITVMVRTLKASEPACRSILAVVRELRLGSRAAEARVARLRAG